MNLPVSLWIEVPVALLLVTSGLFTLAAGFGVLRFDSFFMRLHPPALAFSLSAWCVSLATILYFSAQQGSLSLQAWLIVIFLSLTVPVTTTLLARTELFRRRPSVGDSGDMPAALSQPDSPTRGAVPGAGNNGHAP
jgi:multicomponent K+:H+ antiporter subunit G